MGLLPVYHPNIIEYLRGASWATQWYCPPDVGLLQVKILETAMKVLAAGKLTLMPSRPEMHMLQVCQRSRV